MKLILQCHGLSRVTESLQFMPIFKLLWEFDFSFHLRWGTLSSVCAWYSTVPDSSLLTTNKINILLLRPRLMLATERGSSETWWAAWPRIQPKGSVSALRGSCSQLEMVDGLLNCQNCVLLSKCINSALKNRAKIFFFWVDFQCQTV